MNDYSVKSLPKIAVTGGLGQLACALQQNPLMKQFQGNLFSRSVVDITNELSIENMISSNLPDFIINTAAYTAVDKAETAVDTAIEVNCDGARKLAIACERYQIPLIHISTDYIFDGRKSDPYYEDDRANPINHYGKSKYLGEIAVREYCERHIILRVSGLFSEFGHNFS